MIGTNIRLTLLCAVAFLGRFSGRGTDALESCRRLLPERLVDNLRDGVTLVWSLDDALGLDQPLAPCI